MPSLNYKHLRYFWAVARAGSIARAAQSLHLTPHAISGQLSAFEAALGAKLFEREGRRLVLSDTGRRILAHADQIFELGDEILQIVGDEHPGGRQPLHIGISDAVPKAVAYRLVAPALQQDEAVRLSCREGRLELLLADLAIHRLDLVIADCAMPPSVSVRAYSHLLGESPLVIMAAPALQACFPGPFPLCLNGAPMLMPGPDTAIRAPLDRWFEAQQLVPEVVAEFDDSALLKAFGQAGMGFFAAPEATAAYVCRQYGVNVVGRVNTVSERLYAITTEGRVVRPALRAIQAAARDEVFGPQPSAPARRSRRSRGSPDAPE